MLRKFLLIYFILFLTGCTFNNSSYTSSIVPETDNSILIYDIDKLKIVSYNLNTFDIDFSTNIFRDNFFQFSFQDKNNIFTSGHYLDESNFEILRINEDKRSIDVIYSLTKELDTIVPLATNGERYFFMKHDYSVDGFPQAVIVEYINGDLVEFINTIDFMDSTGLIIENFLFYTTYNFDTETYTLRSINFLEYDNIPVTIEDNLDSGNIFLLNNEIYVSDSNTIYSLTSEDTYDKLQDNFYDSKNNLLIQLDIDNNGNRYLMITDAQTKNQVVVNNAISYDINNENIEVYCIGSVETISLNIFK